MRGGGLLSGRQLGAQIHDWTPMLCGWATSPKAGKLAGSKARHMGAVEKLGVNR